MTVNEGLSVARDTVVATETQDREGSRGVLLIDLFGALSLGLLALVLGLHEIDRWPFWHDEAFTIGAISGTWDDLVRFAQQHEINMFTYYATLKAWVSFGTSDAWVRSLSAIYGALAVVSLFGLVRSMLGRQVAWLATAIFALNAFLLQYSQEARVYTLALLLAILSTWALVRALQAPSRTRWVIYIALAALLPYSHLVLVAMLPVHAIAALAYRPRPQWRVLIAVAVAVGALIVPALILSSVQQASVLAWVPPVNLGGVLRGLRRLDGAGGPGPLGSLDIPGIARVLAIGSGILIAAGVLTVIARRRSLAWAVGLFLVWAILPVAAVLIVSTVKPLFVVRYLIYVIPAIVTLVAVGILALPRPSLRIAAAIVVLALTANGAIGWYGFSPRPDWRAAAAWVVARSTSDDRAAYIGYFGRELPYYATQFGAADRIPVTLYHGLDYRSATYPDDLARIAKGIVAHDRVLWVVLTAGPLLPPDRDPRLAPLRQIMRITETVRLDRIVVAKFVPIESKGK